MHRLIAGTVSGLFLLAGCGSPGSDDGVAGAKAEIQRSVALPPDFATGGLAATDDVLLRLGGYEDHPDLDGVRVPRRNVRTVDLTTGKVDSLPPWEHDGQPVQPMQAAVIEADVLVVLGITCGEVDETGTCLPRHLVSATIDLNRRIWNPLRLPASVDGPLGDTFTVLDRTAEGQVVAAVADPDAPEMLDRLLVFQGGAWSDLGVVDATDRMCATKSTAFVLEVLAAPANSNAGSTIAIERIDLSTGRHQAMPMPDGIIGVFGGAGVHMACDSDAVYLASSGPASGELAAEPLTFWRGVGGDWESLTAQIPKGLSATKLIGGSRGVVLAAARFAEGARAPRYQFAVSGSHVVQQDIMDNLVRTVWLGDTGDLLRVQPSTDRFGGPYEADSVEVWK